MYSFADQIRDFHLLLKKSTPKHRGQAMGELVEESLSNSSMEPRKRNRKPVVCNVCRKRKIKCDRTKPVCAACKKSNVSHLCTYEEPVWTSSNPASYQNPQDESSLNDTDNNINNIMNNNKMNPHSNTPKMGVFAATKPVLPTSSPEFQQRQQRQQRQQKIQQQLQQQQIEFQHNLQLQQQNQHNLQNMIAAKYGSNGKPLTGAVIPAHPLHLEDNRLSSTAVWGGSPAAQSVLLPPIAHTNTPNMQNSLQAELEFLRNRVVQIEGFMDESARASQHYTPSNAHVNQLLQQQQQYSLGQFPGYSSSTPNGAVQLPPINQLKPLFDNSQAAVPTSQAAPDNSIKGSTTDDEDNIDPSLFKESQIMVSHKTNTPNSVYLHIETNGLFEINSFIKKDPFLTNFYLHLKSIDERKSNGEYSRKRQKLSDNFEKLNGLEIYLKYESHNINDLLKKTSKLLPFKKIIWLLIDKFFTNIADPFIPVLTEQTFLTGISKIIGPKELNDSRVKLTVDINEDCDLVNLAYLLIILRISHLSLKHSIKLDKFNNFLLKNSTINSEVELIIDVLLAYLGNFKIDQISRLKLNLLKTFLKNHNEGAQKSDEYPSALAISLNLNNKNEIGSNEESIRIWYHSYLEYYNYNLLKGLPIFLNDEFFDLDLANAKNGSIGDQFYKAIVEFSSKEIELNKIIYKISSKLFNYSHQELTVTSLMDLIQKYDEFVLENFKDFDVYKNDVSFNFSTKIMNLQVNARHKITKLNLYSYILLHYDRPQNKDKVKFNLILEIVCELCVETFSKVLDVFRNYNSYFNSGYEFIIIPPLISLMEAFLKFLNNVYIRLQFIKKQSLTIPKFFINLVDELKGLPILSSYFRIWKLENRIKNSLDLYREAWVHKERGDLFIGDSIQIPSMDKEIKDNLSTNLSDSSDADLEKLDNILKRLNSTFDNRYTGITDIGEFYKILDFGEVTFDLRFFY